MKKQRKVVVIAEAGSVLTVGLLPWLAERGYLFQTVDDIDDIVVSLISRNRISVLLVDDSIGELVCDDIAIVRRLFGDIPIIVTTKQNDAEKEKNIRKLGIFYYHVKALGMDDLKTAILCAMRDAVESACLMGRQLDKRMPTHI